MDFPLSSNQLEFLERCAEARRASFSFKNPLIVHHFDADGLSSGAIVQSAFRKEKRKYRALAVKKLDDALIEKLKSEEEIIFVDLGGGNRRVNELKDVVIIDHHQTEGVEKLQANPMLFGIDGGMELSAAGSAAFVFDIHYDLGVVGAVGDMEYPLIGMNRYLLQKGIDAKEVEAKIDLRMYGRHSRPLVDFLAYSDEPFIPSLSYNLQNCEKFLSDLNIPLKKGEEWRNYSSLSVEEKKKLVSALAKLLVDKGMGWAAEELVGETYLLLKRENQPGVFDANEFSTALNACGRHGAAEIGVGICLNDEGAYEKALLLLRKHKLAIREGVSFAKENLNDFGPFLFIDARGIIEDSIIGIVCGMVGAGKGKPVLGAAISESGIKISSRGTKKLVDGGLNLGKVLSVSTQKVGGVGGGHRIAAGANIPQGKLNPFLHEVGTQLRH